MAEHHAKLGTKGRFVLPAAVRRALDVQDGDRLLVRLADGEVRISSTAASVREAQRAVRRYVVTGSSMADELIAERRAEAARE